MFGPPRVAGKQESRVRDGLQSLVENSEKVVGRIAERIVPISTGISYSLKGCLSLEMSTNDQTPELRYGYHTCGLEAH
jgi:hypothetical protein